MRRYNHHCGEIGSYKRPSFYFMFVFMLIPFISSAQNFTLPQGEYMDSTRVIHSDCSPPYGIYYFEVKAKYPVGSETLRNDVVYYMTTKSTSTKLSGYITFKFFIDCKGTMSRVRVMQTDENYNVIRFAKNYVNDLYEFVKTLNKWPVNQEIEDIKHVNYIAFITFKIEDGQIVNVIP